MVSVRIYSLVTVSSVAVSVGLACVELKPAGIDDQLYEWPPTAGAPIAIELFSHTVASAITVAFGKGLTITSTSLLLTPPFNPVSVRVYMVETVGDTNGLEINGSLILGSLGTEVHWYELPGLATSPNCVVSFKQIALLFPALASGILSIDKVTLRGAPAPMLFCPYTSIVPLTAVSLMSMVMLLVPWPLTMVTPAGTVQTWESA